MSGKYKKSEVFCLHRQCHTLWYLSVQIRTLGRLNIQFYNIKDYSVVVVVVVGVGVVVGVYRK